MPGAKTEDSITLMEPFVSCCVSVPSPPHTTGGLLVGVDMLVACPGRVNRLHLDSVHQFITVSVFLVWIVGLIHWQRTRWVEIQGISVNKFGV